MNLKGKTVALTACSDLRNKREEEQISSLIQKWKEFGISVKMSPYIFEETGREVSGEEKARILMAFYQDPKIEAIFDVSGGDLANELLPYLDFELIKRFPKPFFGYSDLTVLLNGIYARTGQETYLYQIKHLVSSEGRNQQRDFRETFFEEKKSLFQFPHTFIQGQRLKGIVVGGNIRCLLKLAGTPYLPDFLDKVLFLESRSGSLSQIRSYFFQLLEMGVFEKISGLLLGTFTQLEEEEKEGMIHLVERLPIGKSLPIVKTSKIGHGKDSKCLIIGREIQL